MGHLRDAGFSTGKLCGVSPSQMGDDIVIVSRIFVCSAPDRGIFVPFKKVVMAWNQ